MTKHFNEQDFNLKKTLSPDINLDTELTFKHSDQ